MKKCVGVLVSALVTGFCAPASAADPFYVIAVGYNGLPPAAAADQEQLRALQFADDDAAEVFSLYRNAADVAALVAELDADTARRRPELQAPARPPTRAELRRAVGEIAERVAADRRAGAKPTVLFFYSGHGFSSEGGAGLSLADGAITPQVLYDEIIGPLSGAQLHLIVDACHAEAVVRPRDAQAEIVDITPAEAEAYLHRTTLEHYPSVGAIVATTRGARAHEWETYRSGIFTHELLSGLRGGADVNGDGRIEYSEIEAFLAAANQHVADQRARLETVIRTPPADGHASLIDLARLPKAGRLRGHLARLGNFYVEDERGTRLLDVHAEPGTLVTLVLPAEQTLFVRTRDAEAELLLQPGEVRTFDGTALHAPSIAPRGAIESALRRGLFGVGFGPAYYTGYMARGGAALPVIAADEVLTLDAPRVSWQEPAGWGCLGASALLAGATLGMTIAAYSSYQDVQKTPWEQEALSARSTYVARRNWAFGLGAGAVATGIAGWVLWRTQPRDGMSLAAKVAGPGIAVSGAFH